MQNRVFPVALLVAAISGMLSLSYEIVWFRVFAFITGGAGASFGVVLGAFLVGVAVGSLLARWLCRDASATGQAEQLTIPAWLLWAGSLSGFALLPLVAQICTSGEWPDALPLVGLVAGLLGAILPLVAHFGIAPDARAGERMSWLYLANIIGCSTGSLLTGFVLLDLWPLKTVAWVLAAAGAAMAALLFWASGKGTAQIVGLVASVALAAGAPLSVEATYGEFWEQLQHKHKYTPGQPFKHTIENRHGVITVTSKDEVFGGGVYDGVFNTKPIHDHNMVIRPYALSGYIKQVKRVLVIGVASGSWVQIIAHHPELEEMIAVEINPGYLGLIENYPEVKSLLSNKKVNIVIDDGRRWLRANPSETFDVIVMNTTMHWRGSATNLLSREFLEMTKRHLRPGGAILYNTTGSLNARKTGCEVFAHGVRVVNCMLLSESKIEVDRDRWRNILRNYAIDGRKIFDVNNEQHRERIEEMVHLHDSSVGVTGSRWQESCAAIRERMRNWETITEDNMQPEWYRSWRAVP